MKKIIIVLVLALVGWSCSPQTNKSSTSKKEVIGTHFTILDGERDSWSFSAKGNYLIMLKNNKFYHVNKTTKKEILADNLNKIKGFTKNPTILVDGKKIKGY